MNHAYYVLSHQISYHIPQQVSINRNPDNIADQLKLLKSKKHVNQSLHNNKDSHINQHKFISQKHITSIKLNSSRRQKSQDVETIQQSINLAIKYKSHILILFITTQTIQSYQQLFCQVITKFQFLSISIIIINYRLPKLQQRQNCYTQKFIEYLLLHIYFIITYLFHYIKTEPDTQICSDRIICYKTPVLKSKQIQSKEQIKSICKQIYPQNKQTDEITNLKLDIRNQNNNSKLKTEVSDKILDLLMLSTRELKIKLSEKRRTKQTSIPKTAKAGLPIDFFNFKK